MKLFREIIKLKKIIQLKITIFFLRKCLACEQWQSTIYFNFFFRLPSIDVKELPLISEGKKMFYAILNGTGHAKGFMLLLG